MTIFDEMDGGWKIWCRESKAHFQVSLHEDAGKERRDELLSLQCPVCESMLLWKRVTAGTQFTDVPEIQQW